MTKQEYKSIQNFRKTATYKNLPRELRMELNMHITADIIIQILETSKTKSHDIGRS